MPLTPFTSAWPPSLPSVPTSRATRVTSEVNAPICSIIVLTIVAERRNSPCSGRPSTSSRTLCERSPFATALIVRVTSVVGHSRSSMSVLTELSIAPHAPERRSTVMRWRVLPSLPTIWPARSSSRATRWLEATISLKVSAILPPMPVLVARQAHGEIAVAHGLQRAQQLLQIDVDVGLRRPWRGGCRSCDRVPVTYGCALVLGFPSRGLRNFSRSSARVRDPACQAGSRPNINRRLWRRNRACTGREPAAISLTVAASWSRPRGVVIFSSWRGNSRARAIVPPLLPERRRRHLEASFAAPGRRRPTPPS